jgi:hypothetical protein
MRGTRRKFINKLFLSGVCGNFIIKGSNKIETKPVMSTRQKVKCQYNIKQGSSTKIEFSPSSQDYQKIESSIFDFSSGKEVSKLTVSKKYSKKYFTKVPLDELGRGIFSCVFYGVGSYEDSETGFSYLGETDPFIVRQNKLDMLQRERLSDKVVDLNTSNKGFERVVRPGRYELAFDVGSAGDSKIELSVGKTAYASQSGNVAKTIGSVFDRYKEHKIIDKILNAVLATSDHKSLLSDVISFVQYIPYLSDIKSTSYPEYFKNPVETIVEGGGDCEDKALLLACLLSNERFDFEPIMVFPVNHAAVAIPVGEVPEANSAYEIETIQYNGIEYAYIEATTPTFYGNYYTRGEEFSKQNLISIYDGGWKKINLEAFEGTSFKQYVASFFR